MQLRVVAREEKEELERRKVKPVLNFFFLPFPFLFFFLFSYPFYHNFLGGGGC